MKTIKPTEYETINTQRKCLYAKKDIKKGSYKEKFNSDKRSRGGILPKYLDIVIGRKAKKVLKRISQLLGKIYKLIIKNFKNFRTN